MGLLFFAPLGAAFYLYYAPGGWRPVHRVNHGDLIDPARPLPEVSLPLAARESDAGRSKPGLFKGKWTLLYVGAGSCAAECRTDLYNTRQVRLALNREMDRVQRVFIADGDLGDWPFIAREHPDLITLQISPEAAPLLALLRIDDTPVLAAQRVYLIDPLGNLMMFFAADSKPKGMLTDLKRLLGLSHVG